MALTAAGQQQPMHPIGNHLRQVKNGTEFRGRYNSLNELAEREIAGAVRVQGTADGVLPIGVKVDGRAAETQGVDADTAAFRGDSPLRPRQTGEKAISIVATDSNQPPKRTEAVRTVQLPDANPVQYTYDADGNLLSDGRWTCTWTTECRLATIESTAVVPATARQRLEFTYDAEGRRRWRKAYTWDTQAEDWVLTRETTFVYDGWNLIYESTADHTQAPAVTSATGYVWGLDLSQTLQGAGGVGGLLSVASSSAAEFVSYDGNGNVVALVDTATGAVSAEYDYSPFGETVKASGSGAAANPFRFSTKYSELSASGSELYYYGLRYYSPGLGRWVSRDPVGEVGGWNLQAFCANSPTLLVDAIGLEILRVISDATGNPCYIERADLDRLQDYVELSAVPGVVDNGLAASSWLDKVTGHAGANIDQNHRYIYVVGNGWIDLQHVTSSLAVPGAQYGLGFDLGVWFEAKQWIQGLWNPAAAASAFSPEDITSNFLGSMAAFSAASSLYVSEGDAVHNILDLLQPQSRVEAWTLLCKECPPR